MRLEFPSQVSAQSFADKVHAQLIAVNPAYAESVAAGHTKAWAKPYQDLDEGGKSIGAFWYVNVKGRCLEAMTLGEKAAIKVKS